MKQSLRWMLTGMLAASALGASALAQSSRESTLVIGADLSDLITLDPGASYEFSGSLITDNLYDTLVRFEGTDLSRVRPGLAQSWSVAKLPDGGSRITFKLKNAKFASGNPVTARDVVYSFDRVIALKTNSSFLLTDVANVKVGSTKAADDKTVTLDLPKTANPNIVLNLLTFNVGGVVDSVEVAKHITNNDYGSAWLSTNSAGSGPYVLNRWDKGAQVALDANPNASRRGQIKRVVLRNQLEANAQSLALNSGDIDIAYDFTPEGFQGAQKDNKFKALKTDTFQMQYLGMNSGPNSPFADARVRQAVRYAIDQKGIIDGLLGGLGRPMQTIIPAGLFGADTKTYFPYDPEKAKALLKAAGKEGGFEVEFTVTTGSCGGGVPCADLAAKVQADLAKVGIRTKIRQIVQAEALKLYRAQQASLIMVGWSPDYPDPDGNGTPLADYGAKSLAWRNNWKNDAASKLAQAGSIETDRIKRAAIYKQLTQLMAQEGPYAILYQPYRPIVTSAKISGFVRNANGNVDFTKVKKSQ